MASRWWWIAGGLLLLAGGGAVTYAHYKQRGIRNNNPGNIRRGTTTWRGMAATQADAAFLQFTTPEYGIRAMAKILRTYMSAYGLRTVAGIISRWAPPNENNTAEYVAAVARAVGKSADALLTDADLVPLVTAIIKHENGLQPYPENLIRAGVAMA